jgi:phosphoesterase RecJ-like protein
VTAPSEWGRAIDALRQAQTIAIACHVNPDGDALGAVLGASLGLRKLGKKTWPSWGTEPLRVPPAYAFLPAADSLLPPSRVAESDVFLALDCGAADRLGELEARAAAASCSINVDHHPGNTNFGTINIVETEASSTAELVARILRELDVELDPDIATCLYTGVVTDTGRFQYSNSSPETLRLAADLLAYEVDAPAIAQEVFESAPFGYLKLVGRMLERAALFEDDHFVYSWITQKDLVETGIAMDETEKLIDLIRSIRDAEVAALFKEQSDGDYRVSMRSKGPRSVGEIARTNGGGGHELAAGFTATDVPSTVEKIRAALREQL